MNYHFIKIEESKYDELVTLLERLNKTHGKYYTRDEINLGELLKIVKREK